MTAIPSRVRQLVNGVWQYVTFDEGGGGGGGLLPSEWTAVVENNNTLRYEVTADHDGLLQLQSAADANTGVVLSVSDNASDTSSSIQAEARGDGSAQIKAFNNDDPDGAGATIDGRGTLSLFTVADSKGIDAWDAAGGVLRFGLLPTEGQVVIGVLTAPPDGDLSASQLAFWFDDTDGAAKLMLKGKSADGTVVTGSVSLI